MLYKVDIGREMSERKIRVGKEERKEKEERRADRQKTQDSIAEERTNTKSCKIRPGFP